MGAERRPQCPPRCVGVAGGPLRVCWEGGWPRAWGPRRPVGITRPGQAAPRPPRQSVGEEGASGSRGRIPAGGRAPGPPPLCGPSSEPGARPDPSGTRKRGDCPSAPLFREISADPECYPNSPLLGSPRVGRNWKLAEMPGAIGRRGGAAGTGSRRARAGADRLAGWRGPGRPPGHPQNPVGRSGPDLGHTLPAGERAGRRAPGSPACRPAALGPRAGGPRAPAWPWPPCWPPHGPPKKAFTASKSACPRSRGLGCRWLVALACAPACGCPEARTGAAGGPPALGHSAVASDPVSDARAMGLVKGDPSGSFGRKRVARRPAVGLVGGLSAARPERHTRGGPGTQGALAGRSGLEEPLSGKLQRPRSAAPRPWKT